MPQPLRRRLGSGPQGLSFECDENSAHLCRRSAHLEDRDGDQSMTAGLFPSLYSLAQNWLIGSQELMIQWLSRS